MKIEVVDVNGYTNAIIGMKLSYNGDIPLTYVPTQEDYVLALRLVKSGASHSKFLRAMTITLDVLAPLYLWKQLDTYKVGTTTLSSSTMHSLHKRELTQDDFSRFIPDSYLVYLNELIREYRQHKDKNTLFYLYSLLPSCYQQRRLLYTNYQVLRTLYHQRKAHKLPEWGYICSVLDNIPYADFVILS